LSRTSGIKEELESGLLCLLSLRAFEVFGLPDLNNDGHERRSCSARSTWSSKLLDEKRNASKKLTESGCALSGV
jgi:hypothetical protein